jgi:hypothetical protein
MKTSNLAEQRDEAPPALERVAAEPRLVQLMPGPAKRRRRVTFGDAAFPIRSHDQGFRGFRVR